VGAAKTLKPKGRKINGPETAGDANGPIVIKVIFRFDRSDRIKLDLSYRKSDKRKTISKAAKPGGIGGN
jgi:hypothetical protein